jgi:hypothetical protein
MGCKSLVGKTDMKMKRLPSEANCGRATERGKEGKENARRAALAASSKSPKPDRMDGDTESNPYARWCGTRGWLSESVTGTRLCLLCFIKNGLEIITALSASQPVYNILGRIEKIPSAILIYLVHVGNITIVVNMIAILYDNV